MEIAINKISVNEVAELQNIGRLTFSQTFSDQNSSDDMKQYLDTQFSLEKLETELNNSNSEFYFAKMDNEILGYLKLNVGTSQTEIQDNLSLEIERIYVLQEFLGKKVGQLLYQKAIEIAENKNVDFVWLGVWEENLRAINFYKKNGFIEFDRHIFNLGTDKQTDIMMKLVINQ